jgi:inorganic pyrophosphatase
MPTAMSFPVNYGLITETHGEDGDALDALVFISQPIFPGVIVKCQVIGLLEMEDEEGIDHKIVAVPLEKIDPICGTWKSLQDVPSAKKHQIQHYKDLEKNKWVKLKDWKDISTANKILESAVKRFKSRNKK